MFLNASNILIYEKNIQCSLAEWFVTQFISLSQPGFVEGFEAYIAKPGPLSFFVAKPICDDSKRYFYPTRSCRNVSEEQQDHEDPLALYSITNDTDSIIFFMASVAFRKNDSFHVDNLPVSSDDIDPLLEVLYVFDTYANATGEFFLMFH